MQLARDELEHKKAIEKLKEEEAKEMEQKRKQLKLRERYREEIIQQMNLKEQERREKERIARNEQQAVLAAEKKRDKYVINNLFCVAIDIFLMYYLPLITETSKL